MRKQLEQHRQYSFVTFDDGGVSGTRTPDLRIMMKIAPIFHSEINGLQASNPTV